MPIQQEFKPPLTPSAAPAAPAADDDLDDVYEDEPRRRSWGAIATVILALGLVFVGYQWNQAVSRERLLASQVGALRADAESLRLRAEEAQREAEGLQKRVVAVTAEKDALAERVTALERSAQARPARDAGRDRTVAQSRGRTRAPAVAARPVSVTKKSR